MTHAVHLLPLVDYIVVLKDGRVDEMGTFAELMSHNGAFAEFCREYLEKRDDEGEDDEEEEKPSGGSSGPAARGPSSSGAGVATLTVTNRSTTPAKTADPKDEEGTDIVQHETSICSIYSFSIT